MLLGFLFAVVAFFYASVGFGGGSSYLALLALWDFSYAAIPALALVCNIIVVSGNSVHYARAGYVKKDLLLPFIIPSIPAAYIGGRLPVGKELFLLLLFISLVFAGLRLIIQHRRHGDDAVDYRRPSAALGALIGGGLGFLAGITGIGGGIFLSPVLYQMRAGSPRHIAAASSLFILVNSVAGLLGQLAKGGAMETLAAYWYLPALAFVGGQLGNLMVVKWIPGRIIALLTGILIMLVAARLGFNLWSAP